RVSSSPETEFPRHRQGQSRPLRRDHRRPARGRSRSCHLERHHLPLSGTERQAATVSDPNALEGLPLPEQRQLAIGHDAARSAILAQLADHRLPGAIMLHGPQGIGKATLAFELTAAILTATGDEPPHRVHEQIAAMSHPNVSVLRRRPKDAKGYYSVIRVEDVRQLRDGLHHTRGRAGHRIAILDSIDDCNPSAANALLKTLEEP